MPPPASNRHHFEKAIWKDRLNTKSHLVHVAFNHDFRSGITPATIDRAHFITSELAIFTEFIDEDFPHFVLKSGDAVGLRERFEESEAFFLHGKVLTTHA